ncbi:bifunctional folylpolyglutamate synthase/dihydrofolate synthase [Synergistales bacterium]|nr:bifunctional folylpolyglutamate synthase/dihydrofolate synthase [Synergistales bacterium]
MNDFDKLSDDIEKFSGRGIRLGLARISRLLSRIGSPEKNLRVIHVLGTNGKGSTAASMESICLAAGMRTALYTSPHLVSLQERLRISGSYLPAAAWRGAWERAAGAVMEDEELNASRPTFFESLTALCFLMMQEAEVDIAVVEAGLGGRYDATSACRPAAVVVTPIGMDHMEYLGNTLESIAAEKFAAIRRGVPAFYAANGGAPAELFKRACSEAGSPRFELSRIAEPRNIVCSLGGTSFDYMDLRVFTPLAGIHQAYNAANAVSVLRTLREISGGFERIDDFAIKNGLANVNWPGRMEARNIDGRVVILDGAHNAHGFRALESSLRLMMREGVIKKIGAFVFAVMKDKDITEIIPRIISFGVPVYCTEAARTERAASCYELADKINGEAAAQMPRRAFPYENAARALNAAVEASGEGEVVVCCGSLYLVGNLKRF